MLKVLVIDDSAAMRRCLGRLLSDLPEVDVVGYAADVSGACGLVDATRPDVVVLDIHLRGGGNGIEVLRHVKRQLPLTQVLALSSVVSAGVRESFREAGVSACFDKVTEFVCALEWIADRAQSVVG